ncbi:DUF1524 domain-containing protein [Cutibacterium avidum]|nr:DUF1524 domain-containing protein [Cutibacterium avidum]
MPDENPSPTANGADKKKKGCGCAAIVLVVLVIAAIAGGGDGDKAASPSDTTSQSVQVETQDQATETPTATAATSSPKTTKAVATANASVATKKGTAAAALAELPVKGRAPKTGYSRDQFGQAWADVDRNGCDTRNDILRRDLVNKTYKPGTGDCKVLSGDLPDPYTGRNIHFQRGPHSSAVQIDHVVALSNAWQTGAQKIGSDKRLTFANDPLNLLAVDGPTNEAKGDGDAATWLPANKRFRCSYVARQVAVKKKYHLWVTGAEHDAIAGILGGCPGQTLPTSAAIPAVKAHANAPHSKKPAVTHKANRRTAPAKRHSATSEATKRHKKSGSKEKGGSSGRTVHGGAFCSSEGSQGVSKSGTTLTCKVAKDGRLRWKK